MSSGTIINDEMSWVTFHQDGFSRTERAVAQHLGRLIDEGSIQLGYRKPLSRATTPWDRCMRQIHLVKASSTLSGLQTPAKIHAEKKSLYDYFIKNSFNT